MGRTFFSTLILARSGTKLYIYSNLFSRLLAFYVENARSIRLYIENSKKIVVRFNGIIGWPYINMNF